MPGYVENNLAGPIQWHLVTEYHVRNIPPPMTDILRWYAIVLTLFFEVTTIFNTSLNQPIAMFTQCLQQSPGNITIAFVNPPLPNSFELVEVGNITCDPRVPGSPCVSFPMAVDQVPTLFGLPEGSEFSSILASMFYLWYWLSLADFGINEDNYFNLDGTSSNPFVNATLFDRYNNFTNAVTLPYMYGNSSPYTMNTSVTIGSENQLANSTLPFLQTYTCSQRQLKGWLSLFVSVIAADVALILGAYHLFIFGATYLQKRSEGKGNDILDRANIENRCSNGWCRTGSTKCRG
jgi:hypothetical protein